MCTIVRRRPIDARTPDVCRSARAIGFVWPDVDTLGFLIERRSHLIGRCRCRVRWRDIGWRRIRRRRPVRPYRVGRSRRDINRAGADIDSSRCDIDCLRVGCCDLRC